MAISSSESSELTVSLPTPHPGQATLLRERKRFNTVACGRRWGKTKFASLELAANAALDGLPVGWFAPTFKILDDAWREMRTALRPVCGRVSEATHRLELVTGGVIECWSLTDEDSGRSRKYALAIVDEAGLVRDLRTRWFDAIRPTLADLQGEGWLFGTPKGRNFCWESYAYGQDPENAEWASWQMPTRTNPYILAQEIEAARKGMPERSFRQEFLAEFIEESGGVFRGVTECVVPGAKAAEPEGNSYLGVDLARVEDFTVLTLVDSTGRQCYFERFNQISWDRQIASIESVWSRFGRPKVVLDVTGVGDPIYQRLRKLGIDVHPYQFTNSSKEALIDNAAMRIEQGEVKLLDVPEQTNELLAYQYELTPSRNVRMNAPEGMHDDCVIALCLALWGLANRRRLIKVF